MARSARCSGLFHFYTHVWGHLIPSLSVNCTLSSLAKLLNQYVVNYPWKAPRGVDNKTFTIYDLHAICRSIIYDVHHWLSADNVQCKYKWGQFRSFRTLYDFDLNEAIDILLFYVYCRLEFLYLIIHDCEFFDQLQNLWYRSTHSCMH